MGCETSVYDLLEHMLLDKCIEPIVLQLSLLEAITNNFSDLQRIGEGGFGVVYKGLLPNGTVAVKKLQISSNNLSDDKFNKEVCCLMRVKHKNIVRFLGYCSYTQGEVTIYDGKQVMADIPHRLLCFEYLEKGSLSSYISDAAQGLEWRERYQIIKGICDGLHYLHENKIVHSDLKPSNILLDHDMVPKIADFGLSRCFDQNQSRTVTSKIIGTMGYMAPESFNGLIAYKSDIFSLGVIITEILTGEKGHCEVRNVQERWKCRMSTPERDRHLEQVRACAEIAIQCIDSNPKKRPVTQQIIEKLNKMESTEHLIETDLSTSLLTHACSSSIELQELIPKVHGHGVTRCKVNMRKLHMQRSEYQSQENQMLQEVNGHAQPRLIIRRVNEYYQSISYRTCKVMLYCFIMFTLSITAILTMAFGNARHVSIAVESATLARFVLDKSSPKLAYNFSFVLTVSNPNWAMSIENTKNLEVGIQFDGQQFDRILLMERGSKLHPLKTARYSVNTSSDGSFVALGNAGTEEFKKQNKAEMFELEVALSGQVRYFLHNSKSRLEASCPLKLYRVPAMTTWIMIDSMSCKFARDTKNH